MGTKGEGEQGSGRSEEEQITISSGTAQKTTEARKVRERQGTTARGPRVPPSQRETETNSRVGCMRKISVDVLSVCACVVLKVSAMDCW